MSASRDADFDVAAVEAGVSGTRFQGRLRHLASVGSTNQLALEAAQAGMLGGVWIAEEQTAGRGRGGHGWHSAAGDGLYLSALVVPRVPLGDAFKIPLATGLAAQAAVLEVTGLKSDIRWPNDLMFGGKKYGGILVESALEAQTGGAGARLRYVVIGVGINVNHAGFAGELESVATSLAIEGGGRRVARETLATALLRHLDREMDLLDAAHRGGDVADILDRFAEASTWVTGKRVRVEEGGGYTGLTSGLDRDGFLLVKSDDGATRTVLSGGVRAE